MRLKVLLTSRGGTPLLQPTQSNTTYPYLILGAGCAGLSLAWNLLEAGITDPILIVDRRSSFENDRTWCFWDIEPTPFSSLATHSWSRWMIHDGDREIFSECPEYPYIRIRSADFYRRVLDRFASASNVTLALGQPVLEASETSQGVRVITTKANFEGLRAFNSMMPKPEVTTTARTRRTPVSLLQHFFGQTIQVDHPVFDPACPTLMDFRTPQTDGPHFVYVLPLSETEALVENTYLFSLSVSKERHRQEIGDYLKMRYGLTEGSYKVIEEESGAIPMTTATSRLASGSRVTSIGLAGGAARPSSGYAFLRIQRQTRSIAQGITDSECVDPAHKQSSLGGLKYQFLDTVFLQCLADRPALASRIFGQMFDRADSAAVVRFMGERSTIIDDLRIVAALPKLPFMTAALNSCSDWFSLLVRR
jgi:lycopene beta-cyclase